MSYTQEVISQITTVPEFRDIEMMKDTLPAAVLGTAGLYGLYRFSTDHLRSPKTDSGLAGADPIALEMATSEKPKKLSHMRKISAVGATSLALMTAGAHMLDPITETETVNPNATTAVIVDGSYSMRYPADMSDGETRLGASLDGIARSLDSLLDGANPAVIITSSESELTAPAGVADKELSSRLNVDTITTGDKANLAPAIEIAQGLQNSGPNAELSQVIITDGTISDMTQTREALTGNENATTTVILTGTAEGTYNLSGIEGADVSAAVNESFLSDMENVEVIEATAASEIEDILQETIRNNSIEIQEKSWDGFLYATGALGLYSVFQWATGRSKPLRKGSINWRKKEK